MCYFLPFLAQFEICIIEYLYLKNYTLQHKASHPAKKSTIHSIIFPFFQKNMSGKHYGYLLKTDGTRVAIDEKPTLDILQKFVGRNIELLPVKSKFQYYGNEEAVRLKLQPNKNLPQFLGDIIVVNEGDDEFEKFEVNLKYTDATKMC